VLNADDEHVIRMSAHTEAKHLCYVTMNPQHAVVREHIRAGGRACALEAGVNGQMITLYDKGRHIPLMWTHLIPATLEGRAMHNVQNAMFAAAMAFSMDIKLDAIRQGLRTFDSTFFQAPGRMNVFDEHPFKVIFDYGTTRTRWALADLAGRLDVRGRRIVVVAGPGDRRDEDIRDIAGRGRAFRPLHLPPRRRPARPRLRRGAADDRRRAARAGVPDSDQPSSPTNSAAIDAALRMGQPGDLLLIFADALTRSGSRSSSSSPMTGIHGVRPSPPGQLRHGPGGGPGAVPRACSFNC
jgi:cyanophycin synthetase